MSELNKITDLNALENYSITQYIPPATNIEAHSQT